MKNSILKTILFKNGKQSAAVSTASQTIAKPVILSLYQQGGKSSSVFIRLAGFSGKFLFCLNRQQLEMGKLCLQVQQL